MPLLVKDRVKETSTTAGTGTLTLDGAAPGFQSFAAIGNGNTTYYTIVDNIANTWEVGIGTYTASGTTLSRDTVLANSLGTTALINFASNSKDVFVTYPAERAVYYQSAGGVIVTDNSATDALRITQTGAGNALVVEDSANPDATPFVVNADGRVIVGSTTPISSSSAVSGGLQSVGIDNLANANFGRFSNDGNGYAFYFSKSRGTTVGSNGIVSNGDFLGAMFWDGNDGAAQIRSASIAVNVDGTPGTNDMPGRLVFSTTADGASSPTERMRINSAGNVGIGATPLAGVSFIVGKNVTGSTIGYGVRSAGQIQTDVTSQARMFDSSPTLASGSFTLTTLYHYYTSQGSIGGATVTNQIGYLAESTLTGATNNYGFYSNIASGTGRWNFYANGTAANYFNGATTVNADLTVTNGAATARINPRVSSTASASSVTPDVSAYDQYNFTALAATLTINAPTGTPVDGNKLIFRILDNGTSQTLNWDGTYTAIGAVLPTTTTINKTTYVGCIYNANNTRWDVVAVTTQA